MRGIDSSTISSTESLRKLSFLLARFERDQHSGSIPSPLEGRQEGAEEDCMLRFSESAVLLCTLAIASLLGLVDAVPSPTDLVVEHLGVPFPSWSSPTYSNATQFNLNPHLSRYTHLAPRFHRLLRYGMDIDSKSQTAIFVAGRSADDEEQGRQGASVISALNPRNGGIGVYI